MSRNDEPQSNKPEQMIYAAQAEAAQWYSKLEEARGGVPDAVTVSTARTKLHSRVMLYWTLLRRYNDQPAIESIWHDEDIEVGDRDFTLEDLDGMRLENRKREETYWDPDTGSEETRVVTEAWQMEPAMALAVHDQLDRCASKLGFDADVKKEKIYPEPV